jgi:aminoglycoside phosphotransferase (APT) family kinase protein
MSADGCPAEGSPAEGSRADERRAESRPTDPSLRQALERVLADAGAGSPLSIRRARSRLGSTFPLERLTVRLGGGAGELHLAFKRLELAALAPAVRLSKPDFVFDPAREPLVYAELLPLVAPGPARFFGAPASSRGDGRWLFVEWVEARPLNEVGARALWYEAARWLALMHVSLARDLDRHRRRARLLEHDAGFCMRWVKRAAQIAQAEDPGGEAARFLGSLQERYGAVVHALLALPRTVVHGDFYAANVLVDDSDPTRVAPVDWEMAAIAPGLTDLAALTSGRWSEQERAEMLAAYRSVEGVPAFSTGDFELVRLHHAVQRLGWAPPAWRPPRAQRHDWLGEAIALAEALGV